MEITRRDLMKGSAGGLVAHNCLPLAIVGRAGGPPFSRQRKSNAGAPSFPLFWERVGPMNSYPSRSRRSAITLAVTLHSERFHRAVQSLNNPPLVLFRGP